MTSDSEAIFNCFKPGTSLADQLKNLSAVIGNQAADAFDQFNKDTAKATTSVSCDGACQVIEHGEKL